MRGHVRRPSSPVRWRLRLQYDDGLPPAVLDFDQPGPARRMLRRAQRNRTVASLTALHLLPNGTWGLPTLIAVTSWRPRRRLIRIWRQS